MGRQAPTQGTDTEPKRVRALPGNQRFIRAWRQAQNVSKGTTREITRIPQRVPKTRSSAYPPIRLSAYFWPMTSPIMLTFADRIGQEIGLSDWVMIDQARIDQFARATDYLDPMHIDPAWAGANSRFHTTIAFGFLT